MKAKRCPVFGCIQYVPFNCGHVMCPDHWALIPSYLQHVTQDIKLGRIKYDFDEFLLQVAEVAWWHEVTEREGL